MGLTVHYTIELSNRRRDLALKKINAMRSLAIDLGFESVSDVVEYDSPTEETVSEDDRWMFIQSDTSVNIPWTQHNNGGSSRRVHPDWFCGFTAWPGDGCESMEVVLAEHPRTIEVDYKPEDDARFQDRSAGFDWWSGSQFDWKKWERWCKRNDRDDLLVNGFYNPARLYETRTIKVPYSAKIGCSAFCKTQYASEFGAPHFVRCHLSVCHLLKRIGQLPGVKVTINDEGHYETAVYSDNWNDPDVETTYVPHDATYSIETLLKQCGDYNNMIAALTGALNDVLEGSGMSGQSPITNFPNFEHLEAAGANDETVIPMLEALKSLGMEPAAA